MGQGVGTEAPASEYVPGGAGICVATVDIKGQ